MNHELAPLVLAMMLAAPLAQAGQAPPEPSPHESHQQPADHGAIDQTTAPAMRWQADAPLAKGMARVRAATQALSHGSHGHLDVSQVKSVSVELEQAVQYMIAQCRLDPAPDAALHPLLARVLQASALLADGVFDADALAELEAVLARYPMLFQESALSEASAESASMP